MQEINDKMQNRFLTKKDYKFYPIEKYDINLEDTIILYNTGDRWKIVPLFIFLSYPIIYDTYVYEDIQYDVSVIVCPITLRCVMFKGIFKFNNYDNYRMILKEDDDIIPIDLNHKISEKFVIQENKRIEVKIMTLKNALMIAPDQIYIKIKKKLDNIINIDYYKNENDIYNNIIKYDFIHPKTLVYIVKYQSKSSNENKYFILVGNDVEKNKITGFDVDNSKLNKHLVKYRSKIIDKDGYIMPILWYLAKKIYEKYKVVYLR